MPAQETVNLSTELQKYGVPDGSIKSLREPLPETLDYLDLIEPRGGLELSPDYVVESQGRPLLFVVNAGRLSQSPQESEKQIQSLRHAVACRGQRAYVARLSPGQLSIVSVALKEKGLPWKEYTAGSEKALSFFPRLARGHYDGKKEAASGTLVFDQMFKLLNQAAKELVECDLDRRDVLSLVGRALFLRFLRDRKIVNENDAHRIALQTQKLDDCFSNPENAAQTCQWLDDTFNGDFLPLTGRGLNFFQSVGQKSNEKIFSHLNAITRAYEATGEGNYQLPLWNDFDFAHVPVGLLSQVYEEFSWKWGPDAASTSVHYTPRNIAETLVGEVFDGLPDAHKCRVLDPACGAGVFLVIAFHRLYRELWKATDERPDTAAIRKILMEQIKGFDISESALQFAALSLYLTAIELDPDPNPPKKLIFENLRDTVLIKCREDDDAQGGPVLGSLNPKYTGKFDGQFDIVVSNPPWTSFDEKHKSLAAQLNEVSKDIIRRKGDEDLAVAYHNPDSAPDLPFLWKSTEWCVPGGRIAMALPARILFKKEDVPSVARKTLFQSLEVNGIINCTNARETQVWPEIKPPIMLLFASNRQPKSGHRLHFVTPYYDKALNRRGEMWIDSKSATPVEVEATFDEPWLWKALTVGTALDIEIVRKMKEAEGRPLGEYWEDDLQLKSRQGYIAIDRQESRDAGFLRGLPELDNEKLPRFYVKADEVEKKFNRARLAWPRTRDVYQAPLVLIKESPGVEKENGRALLSFDDVVYDKSFYGYSTKGHPQEKLLAQYIHLFMHSDIWMHYALLNSPVFGAERRRFYKCDINDCPIIPLDSLTSAQEKTIARLSERLIKEDMNVFDDIDSFFAGLYGLDELDMEVIRDTLAVGMPYESARQRACNAPNPEEFEAFRQRLMKLLKPFFNVVGRESNLTFWQPQTNQRLVAFSGSPSDKTPYGVLLIGESDKMPSPDEDLWRKIVKEASKNGATRIFYPIEGGLAVAMLNQYRYWTPTRARLCAAEIVRNYMDIFED